MNSQKDAVRGTGAKRGVLYKDVNTNKGGGGGRGERVNVRKKFVPQGIVRSGGSEGEEKQRMEKLTPTVFCICYFAKKNGGSSLEL